MSFLVYPNGDRKKYAWFSAPDQLKKLDLNYVTDPSPFPGPGFYRPGTDPLYDGGSNEPMNVIYGGTQRDRLKISDKKESVMRQNGTRNLPDHFSRYGYNAKTGTCGNGYCLGNFNGRWIVGEEEIGKGVYADPLNVAPDRYYLSKTKTYWTPHSPPSQVGDYK